MHSLPYAANCSLLFTEVPLLERPAAAYDAGFRAVEFWWPWPAEPVPSDHDVDSFVATVADSGVQLVGLNFFAGELTGPDCGVLSIPARSSELHRQPRCRGGHRRAARCSGLQRPVRQPGGSDVSGRKPRTSSALQNLSRAASAGEPDRRHRSGRAGQRPQAVPSAHRRRRRRCGDRGRATGASNIGFLFDLFHLANNRRTTSTRDDLDAPTTNRTSSPTCRSPTIRAATSRAPAPWTSTTTSARIEPSPDTPATSRCEYIPTTTTTESLGLAARRAPRSTGF